MDLVEARARGFETTVRHPWERARLALAGELIARHVRLQPGDAVLDIGCGDTFIVEALARRYPAVQFYAVDTAFTGELIEAFPAKLGVANLKLFGSLDAVSLTKPAALVLLMDVIEHVADDVAFLHDVCGRPYVGPDTQFLITVPSFQWLFCSHDRFLGHHRRYSRRMLRRLFSSARLASIEAGYLFASLLPVRVLQVVRERIVGFTEAPTNLATWRGSDVKARALAAILTFDGRLALQLVRIGVKIPGLSHFAICRKSA